MADAPEIPEASDPFAKRVAISIAMLAVALSVISNRGDNAKTDAIIKTNEASNQWAYYQAKSIKGQLAQIHADLLAQLAPAGADLTKDSGRLRAEALRYGEEKEEIKKKAEEAQKEAGKQSQVNDRCDLASLLLQIGVVVCSVAILSRWQMFWFAGLALGAAGVAFGVTAFLM